MKCAVMQPTYIPWLGYFDLIDQVDKFVFLDNVQLTRKFKGSWDLRNRIKTAQGDLYLTLPVKKNKSIYETMLCGAYINYELPWIKRHLKSIEFAYKRAPYFNEVYPFIKNLIQSNEEILSEFNINIIKHICFKIGINKEFIKASELKNVDGHKDALVAAICKKIDCDYYLSPHGAHVYIEKDSPGGEFSKNGIQLFYQNYEHPVYDQPYGDFISHMSVIDLLFNYGFEKSLEIIKKGRRPPIDYLSLRRDVMGL
jgi:hypothetical protein